MKSRINRLLYCGVVLAVTLCLFIGAIVFLSTVFNINILDNLTLLFNEPMEYGEWEFIEEVNGVEHIYSSANGDNPKEVLSPFSYWLVFRGGMSLILALITGIFAYLIGCAIVSGVLRMKDRTQTVLTEAKGHTLGDHISESVVDYIDRCKEELKTNHLEQDRSVYFFGKKFEKGDRKSIIRLVVFIVLMVGVIGFFVLWNII